jgi:hypothetical protein
MPWIWATGRESRDEDEVNSDSDSVVEEPGLAATFACVYPEGSGKKTGRFAVGVCESAPLFGDAG